MLFQICNPKVLYILLVRDCKSRTAGFTPLNIINWLLLILKSKSCTLKVISAYKPLIAFIFTGLNLTLGKNMTNLDVNQYYKIKLSNNDFNKLSNFINSNYGIKMPKAKRIMLQSRLQKRLKELNFTSFKQYCDYLFSAKGQEEEVIKMMDVVSTNKTDFFREPAHFNFLKKDIPNNYINNHSSNKNLKIWSAGCSSGEEAYTLAIILSELKNQYPEIFFSILATDISTKMLDKASLAIYDENKIDTIPLELKKKYFLKSKDHSKNKVRVIKELRNKVNFSRLNFMDNYYKVHGKFDCIFCRNTLIYFDHETQEKVINKLCLSLKKDGYFFLGHSESINNMNVPLKQIQPTIFKKI